MDAKTYEFRCYIESRQELATVLADGDLALARTVLGEIDAVLMHSRWPRMRAALAATVARYADCCGYDPNAPAPDYV